MISFIEFYKIKKFKPNISAQFGCYKTPKRKKNLKLNFNFLPKKALNFEIEYFSSKKTKTHT